jgi:hypothetical protein
MLEGLLFNSRNLKVHTTVLIKHFEEYSPHLYGTPSGKLTRNASFRPATTVEMFSRLPGGVYKSNSFLFSLNVQIVMSGRFFLS